MTFAFLLANPKLHSNHKHKQSPYTETTTLWGKSGMADLVSQSLRSVVHATTNGFATRPRERLSLFTFKGFAAQDMGVTPPGRIWSVLKSCPSFLACQALLACQSALSHALCDGGGLSGRGMKWDCLAYLSRLQVILQMLPPQCEASG